MSLSSLSLVPMAPTHLAAARGLSAALGWPHRADDWAFVLELGHGLAALDGDRLIGIAMWWPMGADHATLGMVIVAPERQGSGLGRRLIDAILVHAGPRCVLLNATQAGLPLYAKLGFAPLGGVCQHQGALPAGEPSKAVGKISVRALRGEDVAAVRALDKDATGLDRAHVLQALLRVGGGLVYERDGPIEGYALARPFGRGRVIGPVAACEPSIAQRLIEGLIECHPGGFLRIDVPAKSGLSGWLEERGLPKVSEVVTMARGAPPAMGARGRQLYALASQALG